MQHRCKILEQVNEGIKDLNLAGPDAIFLREMRVGLKQLYIGEWDYKKLQLGK